MTTPKINMVCPVCRSDDIAVDASARWDIATQQWVLSGTQDTITCQQCDAEFLQARRIAA